MQQVHKGRLTGEAYERPYYHGNPHMHVVQMATGIVTQAKALLWDEVEALLEIFKESFDVGNGGFWEDEQ